MTYATPMLLDPRWRPFYLVGALVAGIASVGTHFYSHQDTGVSGGTLESIMSLLTGPFGALAGMLITLYVCVRIINRLYERTVQLQESINQDKDEIIKALREEIKSLNNRIP